MQDSPPAGPVPASRRRFFVGAAVAGAAAAAASTLPRMTGSPDAGLEADAAPAPARAPEKGGGYSLSEHVKRYYKTASA